MNTQDILKDLIINGNHGIPREVIREVDGTVIIDATGGIPCGNYECKHGCGCGYEGQS